VIATPSQTVGPFFSFGLTTNPSLGVVAAPGAKGERVRFHVRLIDGAAAPVPDAVVELWQADADGSYESPSPDFRGFGRLGTDADGRCTFETIRPGRAPGDRGALDAPHINLCLFMRGLLRHVYTRAYFAGDPQLATDPTLALVPEDRRKTLLAQPAADSTTDWTFVVRLQGADETVFFDL
jgi:protocatechuate 3,4-dioxygenase alpha subunit